MLAPRKTLWSTPRAVIVKVIEWVPLSNDKVVDLGCGDGTVILQWAMAVTKSIRLDDDTSLPVFVGIDIDPDRIHQAQQALKDHLAQGTIDSRIKVSFHCINALEATDLWHDATVLYLYLIPRGLKIIQSFLEKQVQQSSIRIVTYMAPLPNATPDRHESISVPHQPGAAWPLYLYTLTPGTTDHADTETTKDQHKQEES